MLESKVEANEKAACMMSTRAFWVSFQRRHLPSQHFICPGAFYSMMKRGWLYSTG